MSNEVAEANNDIEEQIRWDLADGSVLYVSCERDGRLWISGLTAAPDGPIGMRTDGLVWLPVTGPQSRGVARLLNRYADISDARQSRQERRSPRAQATTTEGEETDGTQST